MVFRIDSFRSSSCMKMLRCSFTYLAMASDNSHLNWSSWFTARKRLVSGVGDLVLRRFFDFLFLCFFFLFLLRCSSSLLELDEEESREEVELILLLFLRELLSEDKDFFLLCLRSSELFSERSTLSSALSAILFQHKFEKKTFTKVLSNSRAPSSSRVNNEKGRRGLGTRPYNVWAIECSISSNGDLWKKIRVSYIYSVHMLTFPNVFTQKAVV